MGCPPPIVPVPKTRPRECAGGGGMHLTGSRDPKPRCKCSSWVESENGGEQESRHKWDINGWVVLFHCIQCMSPVLDMDVVCLFQILSFKWLGIIQYSKEFHLRTNMVLASLDLRAYLFKDTKLSNSAQPAADTRGPKLWPPTQYPAHFALRKQGIQYFTHICFQILICFLKTFQLERIVAP